MPDEVCKRGVRLVEWLEEMLLLPIGAHLHLPHRPPVSEARRPPNSDPQPAYADAEDASHPNVPTEHASSVVVAVMLACPNTEPIAASPPGDTDRTVALLERATARARP